MGLQRRQRVRVSDVHETELEKKWYLFVQSVVDTPRYTAPVCRHLIVRMCRRAWSDVPFLVLGVTGSKFGPSWSGLVWSDLYCKSHMMYMYNSLTFEFLLPLNMDCTIKLCRDEWMMHANANQDSSMQTVSGTILN